MSNVLSEVASFYQHAATDAAEEHRRQAPQRPGGRRPRPGGLVAGV